MATKETSMTELAVAGSTDVIVRSSMDVEALNEFDQILTGQIAVPEVEQGDPEEVSRAIVMQLLGAQSDDELGNFGNATPWKDLLDVPVLLLGFKWAKSTYEQGAPVFAITNAVNTQTGESVFLTCGSMNVLAQLSNLARREKLALPDCVWKLVEAEKQTKAGFKPLHLEKVPVTDAIQPAAA